MKTGWTQEQLKILYEKYSFTSNVELGILFDKRPDTIAEFARKKGLKKTKCFTRKGTLEPLFEETKEAYYWLGFITGDGYISKDGHFMLSQTFEHKTQIEKLARFLQTETKSIKNTGGYKAGIHYRGAIKDLELGEKLKKKLGISFRKTENPPTLSCLDIDWKVICFAIGLIDADGSRRKNTNYITIQKHLSWEETLKKLYPTATTKKDNKGYVTSYIGAKSFAFYSKFALENNLPIFEHKLIKND